MTIEDEKCNVDFRRFISKNEKGDEDTVSWISLVIMWKNLEDGKSIDKEGSMKAYESTKRKFIA